MKQQLTNAFVSTWNSKAIDDLNEKDCFIKVSGDFINVLEGLPTDYTCKIRYLSKPHLFRFGGSFSGIVEGLNDTFMTYKTPQMNIIKVSIDGLICFWYKIVPKKTDLQRIKERVE